QQCSANALSTPKPIVLGQLPEEARSFPRLFSACEQEPWIYASNTSERAHGASGAGCEAPPLLWNGKSLGYTIPEGEQDHGKSPKDVHPGVQARSSAARPNQWQVDCSSCP